MGDTGHADARGAGGGHIFFSRPALLLLSKQNLGDSTLGSPAGTVRSRSAPNADKPFSLNADWRVDASVSIAARVNCYTFLAYSARRS